jgi:hypothetical protein
MALITKVRSHADSKVTHTKIFDQINLLEFNSKVSMQE